MRGAQAGLTCFGNTQKECKTAQGFPTLTKGDSGLPRLSRAGPRRSDKAEVTLFAMVVSSCAHRIV
jgi:hypothetical protein